MTHTESDLTTGEIYNWRIIAINTIGNAPESAPLMVIAAVIPDAPVAPTSTSADKTSISIAWEAPHDGGSALTNYIVQWN